MVDKGNTWIKLSGPYLNTRTGAPWTDATETAIAIAELAPERVVWGSDFPHVTEKVKPDEAVLTELIGTWLPTEKARQLALTDNPPGAIWILRGTKGVCAMTEEYHVAQIPLQYEEERKVLATFLTRHKLTCEPDIQTAFGIYDENDTLAGCGCAAGALLKCFAVEPELRGQNALGRLVSSLIQERFAAGFYDLFVITRRENEKTVCKLRPLSSCANSQPGSAGKYAKRAGQLCQPISKTRR